MPSPSLDSSPGSEKPPTLAGPSASPTTPQTPVTQTGPEKVEVLRHNPANGKLYVRRTNGQEWALDVSECIFANAIGAWGAEGWDATVSEHMFTNDFRAHVDPIKSEHKPPELLCFVTSVSGP
jgi:hypothetical protein